MKKLEKLSLKQMEQEMPVIGSEEQKLHMGGYEYTFSQYESMCSNGTWTGGQVYGYGYIGVTCCAFTSPASYMPISEWSSSHMIGWGDSVVKAGMGEIPVWSGIQSMLGDQYSNEQWQINTALWNSGLTGSDGIYTVYDEFQMRFFIYNQEGSLIYSTPVN